MNDSNFPVYAVGLDASLLLNLVPWVLVIELMNVSDSAPHEIQVEIVNTRTARAATLQQKLTGTARRFTRARANCRRARLLRALKICRSRYQTAGTTSTSPAQKQARCQSGAVPDLLHQTKTLAGAAM